MEFQGFHSRGNGCGEKFLISKSTIDSEKGSGLV